MQRWKVATHRDVVSLYLSDNVLPEAARAEAYSIAEVTDPAPIVLAHLEVVVVAEAEAGVAKLPIAPVLGLLRQRQMPFQVDIWILLHVDLEQFRD